MSVEQSGERPRDDAGRFTQPAPDTFRATEISSAMVEADKAGGRPFDAFTEMPRVVGPADKPETYNSDQSGVRAASQELVRRRQQAEQNAPVIERAYHNNSNAEQPRRPLTETVTAREAAADLHGVRQGENDAAEALRNMSLREKLDLFRQEANAADREAAEVAQPVPQPQPESQAPQQQTNGVHPDVAAALQNPHVRAALEQEATAHATARHQYLQSVQMMGNAAWANVMANFPEMQTGNPQQVLEQMRQTNPARFAEITGHLQRVGQIGQHWQQLRAQQQQQQAAQWHANANAQDQHYQDFAATRSAAENRTVQAHLSDVLKHYGIDETELRQAWNANHPLVRSFAFQTMLHDLAVLHASRKAAGHKAPAHVSRVLRPGEVDTGGGVDHSALSEAMKAWNADSNNPRLAAKALVARRKAAAGLR